MTSPLRYLSLLLFSLSLTASAQTFSPGDYQINRRRDSPTAGFEVAELLAGSNITFTWDNTNKTVTIAGSAGGAATWGTITGTLSAQTDLQTALDAKQATGNYLTALTGDVTATGPGSVAATIANDAVTYAKMQNVSAAARLLGRGPSSGAGDVQEITIGAGLGWSGNELRATGINPFDQDLNTTDPVTFPGITLTNGTIATGANFLDYTHVGTQGDVPELIVRLNDGTTDIGYTLIGFRGDGAGSGASYLQGSSADFRIEQTGGTLANVFGLTFTGTGSNLTALNASNITTGTLDAARLPTLTAGSGTELQRRNGSAFEAVTRSSVSGGAITLGDAEAMGVTSTPLLMLRNTTAAAAGVQQVSPSLVLEGRGWKTDATAASQTVRFRQNILPVQGAANPAATWRLQSEINNSGTWLDVIQVQSGGAVTLGATTFGNYITTAGNGSQFWNSGVRCFGTGFQSLNLVQGGSFGFATNNTDPSATEFGFLRDAANVMALRGVSSPTTAQTFRIYETDSGANDEYLEFSAASGTNVIRPQATGTGTASVVRYHTTTAVFWTSGSGSPESVVTAPVGSLYTRTDGGASTTLYVKESGTGSTGWIAK